MGTEVTTESNGIEKQSIPLLPLRDVVVFPHTVIPLFIGRKSSVNAITQAMEADKNVFLVTQKDETIEEPNNEDLHKVGTLATILQLLKLPDGTIKVLVEGIKRAKIEEFVDLKEHTEVILSECTLGFEDDTEIKAMMRLALENFEKYIKRCIESATNQSLKEIEIIVVNDGSTDGTWKIIEKLSLEDDRLVIINKENGGESSSINAASDVAKGEYIQELDGDDWMEVDACKQTYQYAIENDLDIVVCDYYRDNGNGTVSDLNTTLMWSKTVDKRKASLIEAKRIAERMRLGGYY